MAKSKIFSNLKRFTFGIMPSKWKSAFLAWVLTARYKPPELVFPWNPHAISRALVILPEDPVEAFHQIVNYMQIAVYFETASFVIFCTGKVSAFFRYIHPEATVIEYDVAQRYLFSHEFDEQAKIFSKEEFDLCLVLEHAPDISLLFLAGKTAAAIRAGYTEAGAFPFLNMHINASPDKRYRSEQNCVLARALGATIEKKVHWSVSKEAQEEIAQMFHEFSIPSAARLVGIDVGLFYPVFGEEWTQALCNELKKNKTFSYYCYIAEELDESVSPFAASLGLPLFSKLSAPRSAALVARSTGIISGKSIFFELANLLKKPVIGIFEEKQSAIYCQQSAVTKAATYSSTPDRGVIEKVVLFVNNFEAPRKA